MSTGPSRSLSDRLHSALAAAGSDSGPDSRYCVAFSGGVDSTVLLHLMAHSVSSHRLSAVHVDHGLTESSGAWASHCRRVADRLGVALDTIKVDVAIAPGDSVEARAREARYAALARWLPEASVLLTAHHADDQAETLLLQLLRGAGPAGLAGIAPARPFGRGALVRPMLAFDRESIASYARANQLEFLDDPANRDERFDRNFLRHTIVPLLRERWPGVATTLTRAAAQCGESDRLVTAWARAAIRAAGGGGDRLPLAALDRRPARERRAILRALIRDAGALAPPARRLDAFLSMLADRRSGSRATLVLDRASLRVYADTVYVVEPEAPHERDRAIALEPGRPTEIGPGLGRLVLDRNWNGPALTVRYRQGGESMARGGARPSIALKDLLRERRVLPWLRDRVPLIYAAERLVAVADIALDESFFDAGRLPVEWHGRPRLTA